MDDILVKALKQLGCNDKHIRFYKANLLLGDAPLSSIIAKAKLHRSTAYIIAKEMIAFGLTLEDHKSYKKLYIAAEPDVILRKLEAKQRQIGRSSLSFKEALPQLRAAHQATTSRPKVQTFEGLAGLIAMRKEILTAQDEILLWTNQQTEQHIFDPHMHSSFVTERITKQIPIRALAVNNPEGEALLQDTNNMLRTTKLLPASLHFTGETYIYDDSVAVIDIGKHIFGVITQNKQIADSQRAMFEFAWKNL